MKKVKTPVLNSNSLKEELWKTLHDLRARKIDAKHANSIAGQSREILRVVKLELQIQQAANKKPTQKLLGFSRK